MKISRSTTSLCSTCYREIPASVEIQPDGVWISKTCPTHGAQKAMLERDPLFYLRTFGRGNEIYNGYFVDVTRRCQLRCSPCFFRLEKADPLGMFTVESIVSEARVGSRLGPIILTGGEPTLHPQLPAIISEIRRFCGVELLSNGIKLADKGYFDQIMPLLGVVHRYGKAAVPLNLSIHHKETEAWRQVIEHCRHDKVMIESALIVVDSKESLNDALCLAFEMCDTVRCFRIKAASRLWAADKPVPSIDPSKIFTSDLWNWMDELGYGPTMIDQWPQKPVFINVLGAGTHLMLIGWHDVHNVDLDDIACGPYYRARNGEVRNFVTAALINEGIENGWCNGTKTHELTPVKPPAKYEERYIEKITPDKLVEMAAKEP